MRSELGFDCIPLKADPVPLVTGELAIASHTGNGLEAVYVRGAKFMKFSLSFTLLVALFVSACTDYEEPPQRVRHRVARYPAEGREEYPPQQEPFNPNVSPTPENVAREETSAPPRAAASPAPVTKGDYPYAIPVPGKPHIVESPYVPGKFVDVSGFPPGTEVKDPYTNFQKIFRVP